MKKLSLLILFALAACAPFGAPTATPSPLPTEQPTALPSATPPPTPLPTAALPTTTPTASPTQQTTPGGVQPQAFSDCALLPALPGLPGCGGSKAAQLLGGELILVDQGNHRLVGVDYNTVQAWQIPLADLFPTNPSGAPSGLSFSPSGKLVAVYPPGNSGALFTILDAASGREVTQVTPAGQADWTPQDTLDMHPQRTIWSAQGDVAWIDFNTAVAHVRFAADPGKEVTWPIAPGPSDKIPQAVAWVPGTDLLLFEQHFASNSMWVTGGELSTLDVKTGAVKDLKASLKLDFQLAWHPSQTGVMVFGDSCCHPIMGGQNLAILNVITGELTHPIQDQNVSIAYPSWLPDGQTLLFAASLPIDKIKTGDPFASSAIYELKRDGSGLRSLTKPGPSQYDARPQLLPDGEHFLYFRVDTITDPGTSVLHLAALDGSLDEPLTGALAAPQCMASPQCAWDSIAVYR